jgi:uncharacterized membrane protein YfcA
MGRTPAFASVVLAPLITTAKRLLQVPSDTMLRTGWKPSMCLFVISAWGGFIAIEAATFFLLVLVLAVGYDLVAANVVKALLMWTMSWVSLVAFTSYGEIHWAISLLLSCGTMVGSWVGTNLIVREQARVWVYLLSLGIVSLEMMRLLATTIL